MTGRPEIYVDADACPVKDEILRVAERHQIRVYQNFFEGRATTYMKAGLRGRQDNIKFTNLGEPND